MTVIVQNPVQVHNEEIIKVFPFWPFVCEITGDWWIPLTNFFLGVISLYNYGPSPWCHRVSKKKFVGPIFSLQKFSQRCINHVMYLFWKHVPDSKVHGANMGPTSILSAPDGPHVGHMNLAIRGIIGKLMATSILHLKAHSGQLWDTNIAPAVTCVTSTPILSTRYTKLLDAL